jgi:hypothetical protein
LPSQTTPAPRSTQCRISSGRPGPRFASAPCYPAVTRFTRTFLQVGYTSVAQRRGTKSDNERENRGPLVLFYHASGDEKAHPTFFMGTPEYNNNSLECVIGVYDTGVSQDLEYKLYSFNLGRLRRAQVPLIDSHCVIARLRENPYLDYVTLSIETLDRGAGRIVLEPDNSANMVWMNTYLFPIWTSFRQTKFSINQTSGVATRYSRWW